MQAVFSPDGTRIVTASDDDTAKLWDAVSGKVLVTLEGHTFVVNDAAFSPDGRRVVTASNDTTARVWDGFTGKLIATLDGHGGLVYSAAFSSDGSRIVTASGVGTARVWRLRSTEDLIQETKRIVPRCLTQLQLAQFYLPAEPPRWCITGAGLEAEPDSAKWRPKWPYHTATWRDWLVARDNGAKREVPMVEEPRRVLLPLR
jgi:DNA-binding beta-propeller fold protein YncE